MVRFELRGRSRSPGGKRSPAVTWVPGGASRAARRWMATAVCLGIAASACGDGRRAPVLPPIVSASGPPAVTRPAVPTRLGARLAIGTSAGMEVWSSSTGVFTVGPTERDVDVIDLAWSADGRYLSWQTLPATGPRPGPELWWASLASGATRHWAPLPGRRTWGQVVVTDTGVLVLGATIRAYPARTSSGALVAVAAGPDPPGSARQSWLHGWVVEPTGSRFDQEVRRIGTDGMALPPAVVLHPGRDDSVRFHLGAVDADGRWWAAELADTRTGCEWAGTAELWTASLATGIVRETTPPVRVHHVTERFWSLDVTSPSGAVYASTFDCTAYVPRGQRARATMLWRFAGGRWQAVGADLVAADRADGGPLATIGGTIEVTHGVAAVSGIGAVRISGQVVATGGQIVAWAPSRSDDGQPG